jgi:DNA-formamidopyrimidine glycosylase
LLNKRVNKFNIVGGRYAKKPIEELHEFLRDNENNSYVIESIDVKGKFMWWTMGPWKMWCTYGMSGQWTTTPPDRNTAVILSYDEDPKNIGFHDTRRFGTLKFVKDERTHKKKLESLGPDVISDDTLTPEIFAKRMLNKANRTICEALMDQSVVAGIGNYLRAEILFSCGIDPWRNVTDISSQEYVGLCEESKRISHQSYTSQGASIKSYRNVNGSTGASQFSFKVYARTRCPKDHEIRRERDEGDRMVHWCPQCQPPR